jgi:hypothetical protein
MLTKGKIWLVPEMLPRLLLYCPGEKYMAFKK